jgi:hypothetical protein
MALSGRIALGIGLLTGAASCKADEPWMFAATRHVWTEGLSEEQLLRSYEGTNPDDPMEGLAMCLLFCPLAVDLALLPITATHDWVYLD